jgi:hypothetical protein
MADRTTALLDDSAEAISHAVSGARERVNRAGQVVVDKVDETRDFAAGALHNASETLHSQAKHLPNTEKLAHSAADKLDSAAGYMTEHDTSEMLADGRSFMQRNPGMTLLLGMVLGCTVGWLLRRK